MNSAPPLIRIDYSSTPAKDFLKNRKECVGILT